jgi:AAA ATPase domain
MSAEGTDGGPVAVVIAGDAGIGKSQLAAEVSGRAAAAGWLLLSAGCVDLAEGSVPYLPLVDALRVFTAAELPSVLDHWRRGETEPPGPELLPDTARGRVYGTYLDVLRAPSDQAPLALVVEDVHWADRATRDLLSYLIRGLGMPMFQARVLVLLTYRSDDLARISPVRAWLRRHRCAEPEIDGDPERGAQLWQRIARYHQQDGNGPLAFAAYEAAARLLDSAPPARGRSRLAADHALALAIWDRNDEAVT